MYELIGSILSRLRSFKKLHIKDFNKWWPLAVILLLLAGSFIYGWYGDSSINGGREGYADQSLYKQTTLRLANFDLPTVNQLHFAIGYPLLGVIGSLVSVDNPFMIVSLSFLLASAAFCFLAVQHLYNKWWALIFTSLLFIWDGHARSFNYASELFALPWNNQVLFFAMSFFFWLLTVKMNAWPASTKLIVLASAIAGFTFASREESILFLVPLLAGFLWIKKCEPKKWLLAFLVFILFYLPQPIIKVAVLGDVTDSAHDAGYSQTAQNYFNPSQLYKNTKDTIVNSGFYEGPDPQRQALLQAAPWLWLSGIGVIVLLFSRKVNPGVKLFIIVSLALIAFYLSGNNMSGQKLRFHCLRYISPGFIMLNFATVTVLRMVYKYMIDIYKNKNRSKAQS